VICFAVIRNGYIESFGTAEREVATVISAERYAAIKEQIGDHPIATDGYAYKLRADNLEWELVELPPVEPEPLTDEEALTRYANTLTGASDQTLIEAAETLITERIKED